MNLQLWLTRHPYKCYSCRKFSHYDGDWESFKGRCDCGSGTFKMYKRWTGGFN